MRLDCQIFPKPERVVSRTGKPALKMVAEEYGEPCTVLAYISVVGLKVQLIIIFTGKG